MKVVRSLACIFLLGGSLCGSAVRAQDLTLQDLFEGATITSDDKVFSNWQLDDFDLGPSGFGNLAEIFVTPLDDEPLNPGVKFNIPNGLGSGGTFAVLEFSFDVQTVGGEALIKDNSLWLNGFEIAPGSTSGLVNIFETVSGVSGEPLGSKFVQAAAGDLPDSGDPDHFDSADFTPQSFVHVFKQIEVLGEDAVLTMFEQRFSQIPEPSSAALLSVIGACAALLSRRRRRCVGRAAVRRA